jgi:hypothetical protein
MGRRLTGVAGKYSAVEYFSASPSSKCATGLRACSFDPSDIAFVAIAHHGKGVYVTTEEKHLQSTQRHCVRKSCGVETVSIDELHVGLVDGTYRI